jgi:hypothetical protein
MQSATVTSTGMQVGYASHQCRYTEVLGLMGVAIGHYPAFDVTDLYKARFMDLYLKLVWNYRDLMVLYFTMRSLRWENWPSAFNNIRMTLSMLFYLVEGMSRAMECREDFTEEEVLSVSFDMSGLMGVDETGYLYTQYTVWVDFMYEMFKGETQSFMLMTLQSLDRDDLDAMQNAKDRLQEYNLSLWGTPMPIFHVSRPVNYDVSVIPEVRRVIEREMKYLESRMTGVSSNGTPGTTEIGFTREVSPWVKANRLLVRSPTRAPESIGERV